MRLSVRTVARSAAKLGLILAAAGCGEHHATAPARGAAALTPPSFLISDGRHSGGTSHFFFLPPTVLPLTFPVAPFTGTFDGTVSATARVCAGAATCPSALAIATFNSSGGTGGGPFAALQVNALLQGYGSSWDTRQCATGPCALDPTKAYRLHVYGLNAAGTEVELGSTDIAVVLPPAEDAPFPVVDLSSYSVLVKDLPYFIFFRIEQGIVGAVTVAPATAPFLVGATQQLVATVQDLHGAALPGRTIIWSSTNPAVATVDVNGLVTAVAPGTTTISATVEGQTGTTAVLVSAPNVDRWTSLTSMPIARSLGTAGVLNGMLYVIGGYSPPARTGAVVAYDPVAGSWSAKASMSSARGFVGYVPFPVDNQVMSLG